MSCPLFFLSCESGVSELKRGAQGNDSAVGVGGSNSTTQRPPTSDSSPSPPRLLQRSSRAIQSQNSYPKHGGTSGSGGERAGDARGHGSLASSRSLQQVQADPGDHQPRGTGHTRPSRAGRGVSRLVWCLGCRMKSTTAYHCAVRWLTLRLLLSFYSRSRPLPARWNFPITACSAGTAWPSRTRSRVG